MTFGAAVGAVLGHQDSDVTQLETLLDGWAASRRTGPVRALRQALGFTISVTTAASGDFALLEELVRL